jgi:hypothetical protein
MQFQVFIYGAQGRNRTTDTVIFSHVLYQLSYLGAGRETKVRAAPGVIKARLRPVQQRKSVAATHPQRAHWDR